MSWWPDSEGWNNEGSMSYGMRNVYKIGEYDCSSHTAADCKNNCTWLKRENTCAPMGLWIEDGSGATFELDTGSSIIALSPSYCSAKHLTTTNKIVPEHYSSAPNANPSPTEYPHTILSTLTHPTCTKESLAGVPDGLIGLRPATVAGKVEYSYMDSVSSGDRKLTINKDAGTVCIGSACDNITTERESNFINVGSMSLMGFDRSGQKILLDTGSTQTWKMNDEICILGNNDISRLHIDYDEGRFKYTIDESNIDVACGPDAPSGNWNA